MTTVGRGIMQDHFIRRLVATRESDAFVCLRALPQGQFIWKSRMSSHRHASFFACNDSAPDGQESGRCCPIAARISLVQSAS